MTRNEYKAEICKRLSTAKTVEFWDVGTTERCCHTNVDRWVNEHTGESFIRVRGWVVYMPEVYAQGKIMVQLAAHSVVGDEKGNLFDITPTDEHMRGSLRFVEHIGDPASFWEFEKSNRFILCPNCV